ncbi:MAG TPA: tRNA (adenosine(37)-N6)-threonylcarbamoyltransferase complex dimerization subunit type 1 TsaB, partial [Actinomycetota bacterium]|nr:tRNA (adenosine(37)-N6)-threonylcarbamoyltransferase complex dimerization subunit type 1 TsaB [Actinomycetota bacterium]
FYRPAPGGVTRETGYFVGPPERLAAELAASGEETLLVGNGALLYQREFSGSGTTIEFASASHAFPLAVPLLELALPRFHREEASRPHEVVPLYVRKSDAEINWAKRARSA